MILLISKLFLSYFDLFFSLSPLDDHSPELEQTTLMEGVVERCTTEINCNGVVQMTVFSESINQVPMKLEDLHNANDCDGPSQDEETCNYSESNGELENRIKEAVSDSVVAVISEVQNSVVCQETATDEQYFNEQQISHLKERIRTQISSEDENENESSENKGTVHAFSVRNCAVIIKCHPF